MTTDETCCSSADPCCSGKDAPTPDPTPSVYDVQRIKLAVHGDARGNVRETYRTSWLPGVPPVRQLVRSESKAGVLRGMHLHRRQYDIWHFVEGDAIVRLRDTFGDEASFRADAKDVIVIPPYIAHGFYTEGGCTLLYALTEEYDGSDEYGWYPFDGIREDTHAAWPGYHVGVNASERDLRAPRLADFDW